MTGEIEVGSQFAGFRIDDVLGRGGMGVVYLAWHLTLDKPVALKVVAPVLAQDEEFRLRFLREARQAASIEHPNIVPIYHAGESDGLLFIAMRSVETDLRRVLAAERRLAPGRALTILDQAAGALDAAHQRGLVHRDVKPANILIQPGGDGDEDRAFLTDFGLVKQLDSRTALTRTGMFLGTLEYAAPEQLQGRLVDGRTDQYALSCILFECLTGRPPFVAETEAQMMYAHVFEPPPSAVGLRSELSPAIDGVIWRAMAKDMAARYPTCREMIREARDALGGAVPTAPRMPTEPVGTVQPPPIAPLSTPGPGTPPAVATSPGGPGPPPGSSTPQRRRRPSTRVRVLGGIGMGVVLIAVLIALVANSHPTPPPPPAVSPSEAVLFRDDFSSSGFGWENAGTKPSGGHYANGAYQIHLEPVPGGSGLGTAPLEEGPLYPSAPGNVRVEVTGRRVAGGRDTGYGILCRATLDRRSLRSGYAFLIGDGFISIAKYLDHAPWYQQLKSADTAAVDVTATNRLQAACSSAEGGRGVHLAFSVNGRAVAETTDKTDPFSAGTVGLIAWTGGDAKTAVDAEFDDFVVMQP